MKKELLIFGSNGALGKGVTKVLSQKDFDKIYFFDYWGFPHHKWEKFGKFDRFSTTKFYLTNMVDEILAEKYEKGYQCAMVEKINLKSLNHKKGLIFMIKNNKEKKKSEKNI